MKILNVESVVLDETPIPTLLLERLFFDILCSYGSAIFVWSFKLKLIYKFCRYSVFWVTKTVNKIRKKNCFSLGTRIQQWNVVDYDFRVTQWLLVLHPITYVVRSTMKLGAQFVLIDGVLRFVANFCIECCGYCLQCHVFTDTQFCLSGYKFYIKHLLHKPVEILIPCQPSFVHVSSYLGRFNPFPAAPNALTHSTPVSISVWNPSWGKTRVLS